MNETRTNNTVLIVDDSPLIRTALTELFEGMDLDVDTVASGEEALEAFRNHHYNVIFLDCRMPGMSGPETARAIRLIEHGSHTPIVGMSAHDQSIMLRECLAAGMDDFLDKMSDIEAFEETLLRWSEVSELAY